MAERSNEIRKRLGRRTVEDPAHRHRRLLRTGSQGPRHGRSAEKGDEVAPFHVEHGLLLHLPAPRGLQPNGMATCTRLPQGSVSRAAGSYVGAGFTNFLL